MFIAIGSGLLGMLGWGMADLLAKRAIDRLGELLTLVYAHVYGSLALIIALVCTGSIGYLWSFTFEQYVLLVSLGVLQGIVYVLLYKAFAQGHVSLVATLFSSFGVLAALYSVVFLGEAMGLWMGVALAVVVAGVVCMNGDADVLKDMRFGFKRMRGFTPAVAALCLAAAWTLMWDRSITDMHALSATCVMYVSMTIALLLYACMHKAYTHIPARAMHGYLFGIGFAEVCAYVAITYGYQVTPHTSVVAVLSSAAALPVIVGAWWWLHERHHTLHLFGCGLVVVGVSLLALFG